MGGEYGTSIVVGAGIGVTPVRATLQSIVYFRFKRGIGQTFPDNAYMVWIVNYKQLDAYRFMCRSLKEAEDEMFNLRKKNQKAMDQKLLQIHIFVTSTPKTGEEWEKTKFKEEDVANPGNDPQRDFALWGTHYDESLQYDNLTEREQAPFTEVDIWKCLKKPADEPTQIGDIIIHKGRPKWDQFFQPKSFDRVIGNCFIKSYSRERIVQFLILRELGNIFGNRLNFFRLRFNFIPM